MKKAWRNTDVKRLAWGHQQLVGGGFPSPIASILSAALDQLSTPLYFSGLNCSNLSYQFSGVELDRYFSSRSLTSVFYLVNWNRTEYQNTGKLFRHETSVLHVDQLVKSNIVFTLDSSQKGLKKLNWMFLKYLDFLLIVVTLWPYASLWNEQVR